VAEQCPLCGAVGAYIAKNFFSVECTNSYCTNYSQKTIDRWHSDMRVELEKDKKQGVDESEESNRRNEEPVQEVFDFYGALFRDPS
jgi:hypothetical protein